MPKNTPPSDANLGSQEPANLPESLTVLSTWISWTAGTQRYFVSDIRVMPDTGGPVGSNLSHVVSPTPTPAASPPAEYREDPMAARSRWVIGIVTAGKPSPHSVTT